MTISLESTSVALKRISISSKDALLEVGAMSSKDVLNIVCVPFFQNTSGDILNS